MQFDRPSSEEELETPLSTAYKLAMEDNYDGALAVCAWLIEDEATASAGRRERATILSRKGDHSGAIKDLTALVLAFPFEPADWHSLGVLQLQAGDTSAAIKSFQQAIATGTAGGSSYYTSSSGLFLAQARLLQGDYAAAIAAAELLPEGYSTYIPGIGMRSTSAIIGDARAQLTGDKG